MRQCLHPAIILPQERDQQPGYGGGADDAGNIQPDGMGQHCTIVHLVTHSDNKYTSLKRETVQGTQP